MCKRRIGISTVVCVMGLASASVMAADPSAEVDRDRIRNVISGEMQSAEQGVYGWQWMTPQEREEYRVKMENAKTAEERERIQSEHHEFMQNRAKMMGITLPEPAQQRGKHPGKGYR